jgi:branched-chain amino acid transport system permease protein
MTATTSWNGFAGYSGYIPLGHAAFFGSGAYTFAVIAANNHLGAGYGLFGLIPLAGLVAGLLAIPVGLIALRTRRHTFVVITIAIFFLFQLVAGNLGITGGSSGLQVVSPNWPGATYNDPFYYLALGILLLAVAVSWTIRRSRFGLQLLAIRDDEDRARGLGVRVGRVKLTAFVISAIPIGMIGALYAYFVGQVFPQFVFDPLFDLSIALMAFFGGLGTLSGPLLGGLLLEPLQQYLTVSFSVGDLYLIIYGIIFLGVILLMPRGIVPSISDRLRHHKPSRHRGPSSGASLGGDGDGRAGLVPGRGGGG